MSSVARLISSSSRHLRSQYSWNSSHDLGHRAHAHPVHPVPLHVLVEQLVLLGFGQAAAEVLGGLDDQHEERGVRPVERLGIECVIAPAVGVDALDRLVVAPDLRAGLRGAVAVVDDAHDRVHRAGHALQRLAQQDRMVLDAGAEFGIHVLDRADPDAQHAGPHVAEVLPRQRIGAQRIVASLAESAIAVDRTRLTIGADNSSLSIIRPARGSSVTHPQPRCHSAVTCRFTPARCRRLGLRSVDDDPPARTSQAASLPGPMGWLKDANHSANVISLSAPRPPCAARRPGVR